MEHLPVELIKAVVSLVDDKSLLALRLVSRFWCEATYDLFAQLWLVTLSTDFTALSQRRLEKVSQHQHLASRVCCLRVGRCNHQVTLPFQARYGQTGSIGKPLPRRDSGCLDLKSPEASNLRDVLLRFSTCTEFRILAGAEADFSPHRTPDWLNIIDIWWLLFSVLDKGLSSPGLQRKKGLQIKSFEIVIENNVLDRTDSWPPSAELFNLLSQSSWASHLQHLSIDCAFEPSMLDIIKSLITTAANLQSLTVGNDLKNGMDALFTELACAQQLPAISKLEVKMLKASVASLSEFIGRFQSTLESLSIDRIRVIDGTTGQVIGQVGALDLPRLNRITVTHCFEDFYCPLLFNKRLVGQEVEEFEVLLRWWRNKTRIYGVQYHGGGMGLILSALAFSCYKMKFLNGVDPDTPDLSSGSVGILGARVVQSFR